ncbi:MAG: caspase family protein [Myxococcaceae bacterium]|nr:caspase family protein [Myxococcaceae bacterium]
MSARSLCSAVFALLAAGCATGALEKGGLVKLKVEQGALDDAYRPRRFALLVGISQTADEGFRTLRYAEKDASDLSVALRDPAVGHFDDVQVVTSRDATTRAGLLDAVAQLARKATRPDDVVVVYVSAHGTLARDERGVLRRYLVTSDAIVERASQTALSMDALEASFKQLPSRRRLLVLATCHSGGGKSLLPREVEAELATLKAGFYAPPLEEASRASVVLSASDWGETAREDEQLENDIYTHFFVEALASGDRNGDGAVTATEAHDWARRRTYTFTKGRQRPSAEILEVGADPIVLSGAVRRFGNPELFSYSQRLDGFELKVDGEVKTELPGGAAVAPGTRRVELTKGGVPLFDGPVVVAEGERIELDALLRRTEPRRSVTLTGGAFGFADEASRAGLLPAVATAGLTFRWERLFDAPLALQLGLAGSFGTHTLLENAPFRYQLVTGSVGIDYLWQRGSLQLFGGPEVAGLWLARSFALESYVGAQNVITVMPGVSVGLAYIFYEHFELSARARALLGLMSVDGESRAIGFFSAFAGAGYRF